MPRPRISILSPDLAGNALGRAYVLAKLLQDDFKVSVVAHGEGQVWEPVRGDSSIEYRPFFHRWVPGFWSGSRRIIRRLIDGDLILAVKPLLSSFGLGLHARRLTRRPLAVDIDDWEMGFISDSVYWEARILKHRWLFATQSPLYTRILNRLTKRADAVTVSNQFLQDRYGGTWIPHARDEAVFKLGQSRAPEPVAMFLGTARLNKGLDVLLDAWTRVKSTDARLRIIGTPPNDPIIQGLRERADRRVSFEGPVPFAALPELIASAGVVVIPQQAVRGSMGQLPAKLIDAMAAGRPIISTDVGDIPMWLSDGAGVVVPPGDSASLGSAIESLFEHPDAAARMGRQAWERFLRYGSMSAVRPRLVHLVRDLLSGRPVPRPAPAFAAGNCNAPPESTCHSR